MKVVSYAWLLTGLSLMSFGVSVPQTAQADQEGRMPLKQHRSRLTGLGFIWPRARSGNSIRNKESPSCALRRSEGFKPSGNRLWLH